MEKGAVAMYVTYLELYDKCKKVFEAWGIPDGCREDCAELITWSECVGYSGLKKMLLVAEELQHYSLENIHVEDQTENESQFFANQLPDLLIAKLGVDFLKANILDQTFVQLHVTHSAPSILLSYEATRIAKGAMGGMIQWKEDEKTYLAYATPGDVHPTILEGEGMEQEIPEHLKSSKGDRDYIITAFQNTDELHQILEQIKGEKRFDQLISYETHNEKWNESRSNGILIEPDLWKQISEEAKKVLL